MRGTIVRVMAGVVALAALTLPVQAKDLAQGLRGRWAADKKALFEMSAPPFYKLATPEKKEQILAEATKDMPSMDFEFTADTLSASMGGDPPVLAAYTVTKVEKGTVYFDAIAKKAPGKGADKMYAEFVDDDTIKLSKVGDELILVLKRTK
jgi:hypothetical protein